ncbi:MAG: hypothetical protein KZQ88_18930 [Candidatus Thiodiazotropha sp. (ex Dulcina madagascariensis)]|nr:hypothetical protein [Candidatus Thiodiazotropha sp. (ex Dulcina madagascariensis)]MCU7926455.1 hypothetical protein [Candidatus Thiodiazotropha sp. (ex Dulcina madagascariensis)]
MMMSNLIKVLVMLALSIMFGHAVGANLPAFPGAEGMGAYSVGGRGGAVIKVTNLNDSGPGSFREAVTTSGPRIVVFDVSGIINLGSNLTISDPYITIAGQTSPGGILVTGRTTTINTHDVIIQHMRFRVGSHNVADAERHDTIQVLGRDWAPNDAYNIIFDHCSIGWGIDENMSLTGGVTNTTVQWSIVAQGLSRAGHPKGEHSKGLFIAGEQLPTSVSVHHNYIAHNTDRNPLISSPSGTDMLVDMTNNVVYNWKGGLSPLGDGATRINWVHNYAKQGASSNAYSYEVTQITSTTPAGYLYVEGNIGSTRLSQSDPHWNVGHHWMNEALPTTWRRTTPSAVSNGVSTTQMSHTYAVQVLADVGATKPSRDNIDSTLVSDFINTTGAIIDNVSYPGDYPTYPNNQKATDADNDGMADSWETGKGLKTSLNDASLDKDCDGYTNIEEYLHSLAGYPETTGTCNTAAPSPPTIPE